MSTVFHQVTTGPPGAPTVLLSNSLGSTLHMWDRNVEALSGAFTVVRYDTRGHGRSPVVPGPASLDDLADDALHLLDRLRLERVHLVGLSLGGMTALHLAARNPDRVDRLAVLCSSPSLGPPEGWLDRARLVRASGTRAVAASVVRRWYSPGFLDRETERVRRAEGVVAATPREGYATCCEALAHADLTGELGRVQAPTLALAGADDPVTPPQHLAMIATGVPNGRLLVVPDAAHLANDEQPEVVTAALVTHLNGES